MPKREYTISDRLQSAEQIGQTLVLEKLHYFADKGMPYAALTEPRMLRLLLPAAVDTILARLCTYVWAERIQLEEVTVVVEVPANWWDHLKADLRRWSLDHAPRWMPNWLRHKLQLLRVEQRGIDTLVRFEHFAKYPELVPAGEHRRRYELAGPERSEIRVNGDWRTKVRVAGWWKED